jgi:hypothetical protein
VTTQPVAGSKIFRVLGWVLAWIIPVYCFLLFPLFHQLASGIAGSRQSYFSWPELVMITLPLDLAAIGLAMASFGLKRLRRWAPACFMGSLSLLIAVDALMYFGYASVKPWYRMDGMHVLGLGASSWRFLDSIYFSAAVTGALFLTLLAAFVLWYLKLPDRRLFH